MFDGEETNTFWALSPDLFSFVSSFSPQIRHVRWASCFPCDARGIWKEKRCFLTSWAGASKDSYRLALLLLYSMWAWRQGPRPACLHHSGPHARPVLGPLQGSGRVCEVKEWVSEPPLIHHGFLLVNGGGRIWIQVLLVPSLWPFHSDWLLSRDALPHRVAGPKGGRPGLWDWKFYCQCYFYLKYYTCIME